MKKINLKKLMVLIGAVAIVGACSKDYLDVNNSPNSPTASQVTPDLILPAAQAGLYDTQATTMNEVGNVFMYNWATNITAFAGGFSEIYTLNIDPDVGGGIWNSLFIDIGKLQAIIDTDHENYENHIAIAKIMKVYYYQYLVDLYGDLPYTEAFMRQGNLTPVYDDAFFVYQELISELDSAQVLINNVTAETNLVGAEDIVFGGSMTDWSKFANTVKLKMLIRLSSDNEYATYVQEQFQTLQNAEFITADVTANPGYTNAKPNPFYDTYGFDINGDETQRHRFIRAGDYAVRFMEGSINGVIDPRLNAYYLPVSSGQIIGVVQGPTDAPDDAEFSELGSAYLKAREQSGVIMLAAESYFLQAEAVFKGYLTGNAQTLFESGITASMDYVGVSQADALGYIAAIASEPGLGWPASTNKIKAIMTQKWLATNSINAIESFIELNRTGFPEIPLATTAVRDHRPNRLMYPSSERTGNAENVPSQTVQEAFNTYIFWDPQG